MGEQLAPCFAHSVLHGHKLFVFGGVVALVNPERGGGLAGLEGRASVVTRVVNGTMPHRRSAHHIGPLTPHCGGLHISAHTAVLVYKDVTRKPVRLVFSGHSPHYG